MQEDLRVGTVGDVVSDILLHQICPVAGSPAVIIHAMLVGQSDAGRAWNKLQHEILDADHDIQVIAGSLATDQDGVHSSGALFGRRGLRVGQGAAKGQHEVLESHDGRDYWI